MLIDIWFWIYRLEVLISLGLSSDEATQEYAIEAMAELLTVPAIQVCRVDMCTLISCISRNMAHLTVLMTPLRFLLIV